MYFLFYFFFQAIFAAEEKHTISVWGGLGLFSLSVFPENGPSQSK